MPPELQAGLDQVFKALLKLLVAYKEQRAEAAKVEEVEDDDEEEWDGTADDGEWDKEIDDDEDEGDESTEKLQKLAAQARIKNTSSVFLRLGNNIHVYSWRTFFFTKCLNLERYALFLQAKAFSHADDSDSDFEDYADDEEFQAPIDNVDAFIFFSDAMKGLLHHILLSLLKVHFTSILEVTVFLFLTAKPLMLPSPCSAMSISDPARFQALSGSLDFQQQAWAHGLAQHAEERRKEIEKEAMEKAVAAGAGVALQ